MAGKWLMSLMKDRPSQYFRNGPLSVLQDPRFNPGERVQILEAWKEEAPDQISVQEALAEAKSRMAHA